MNEKMITIYAKNGNALLIKESLVGGFVKKGWSLSNPKEQPKTKEQPKKEEVKQ